MVPFRWAQPGVGNCQVLLQSHNIVKDRDVMGQFLAAAKECQAPRIFRPVVSGRGGGSAGYSL